MVFFGKGDLLFFKKWKNFSVQIVNGFIPLSQSYGDAIAVPF
jgi:hypothetical protein